MNLERVNQIAKAVLYEGYLLYPYRLSSVKNRQRFNFGVLYPPAYGEAQGGTEPCSMHTECLMRGGDGMRLEPKVRFLHLQTRLLRDSAQPIRQDWQGAVEREVCLPISPIEILCHEGLRRDFNFATESQAVRQESIQCSIELRAQRMREDVFMLSAEIRNTTAPAQPCGRDAALLQSLVSTHIILGVEEGEFISLFDPPPNLQSQAAACENVGAWPVLVGDPGQRDTMLASPIILYDYPQIAPESAGDLFDGTEIDEILSLRIMTLTDDEKREIRESDERAGFILERTESMPAEQFMKLHGALRGLRPVSEETP